MSRALATLLVAAAAALALPAPAIAAPTGELTVIAKLKSRNDEGKRDYSFRQVLYKAKAEVGTSRVHCSQRSKKLFDCTGTYTFGDGSIRVAETLRRNTRNPRLAIVRGTGTYAGAAGTLKVDNLTRKTSRNTFRFTSG